MPIDPWLVERFASSDDPAAFLQDPRPWERPPGITVELWDHIPEADARALGVSAADALIDYFMR